MDPNSRFNDRDNTYNSSFSQPNSSLLNKSPNQMKYSSTGHNDHHTPDYTHAPHHDNIYSSQRAHDIRTTHDFHPTQQASGSFSLDHLGISHKPAQSTDLAASGHYQVYSPSYQLPSHHHDTHISNVPKSSHDDVQASLDSARLARNAALELLNQGTGRNLKESHTHLEPLRTSHHGVYSPEERVHEGFGLGAVTSTYANLSTGHGVVTRSPIEETKVGFDHHASNQDHHITPGQTSTNYENLSPEARRILGSSVADEIKSTSHMSPERKPLIHHDSSPNPYLSTLANTAQTTIRDTHTQALVRHSDGNPSSLHRDLFENINDYRLNDPVVSKRTIYTIENNTASVIRSPAHDIRSYHTPERVQKARSPLRSPLDELRHSLNTNSAKISKIVIETVEDGTGVEGPYVDVESLGNNRVDIIMEETVPHGSSHHSLSPYKSPATERLTRRRNEQEAAFREPSDAVRYQTRSDHFDTDHHHYSHDEHHTHHNEEHHHHHGHHEVAPSPAKNVQHREEEETKHDSKTEKVAKEEVHIHKEKKPSHLIVKGVIGLLVIILSSVLWLELFTDIKFDKYYTF